MNNNNIDKIHAIVSREFNHIFCQLIKSNDDKVDDINKKHESSLLNLTTAELNKNFFDIVS